METIKTFLYIALGGVTTLVFVSMIVRVIVFSYLKAKMEFKKHQDKGEENGT